MNYPIKHFSYSCISLFYSCRYCWKEKYLNFRKPEISYSFFEYGIKFHRNVHNYHTGKPYDQELIRIYTEKYPKDYRVKSELKFTIDLPGIDLPLLGFFDGITSTGICDLKTGKTKPTMKENFQVPLYIEAYKKLYNQSPTFVFNHFNGNKVSNIVCDYSDEDFQKVKEMKIIPFLEAIKKPIETDGMERAAHLYVNCPFYVGKQTDC